VVGTHAILAACVGPLSDQTQPSIMEFEASQRPLFSGQPRVNNGATIGFQWIFSLKSLFSLSLYRISH
jgi:hypothetical protein